MLPEPRGWDQNLKLGKGFLVTLIFVGPVVWWFVWRLLKDAPDLLPGSTLLAGGLLFPFIATVVVYVALKTFHLVTFKREITRLQIRGLLTALGFISIACAIVWSVYGGEPFWTTSLIGFSAPLVYGFASGKFDKRAGGG